MPLSFKKVSVMKATQEDMSDVAKLSIEMLKYHNALSDNYFTVYPYKKYLSEFKNKLKENQYIIVAKIDDKVIGFLSAQFKNTPWYKNANVCIINEIAVSEKYRSHGIGSALFNNLLLVCKDEKVEEIKLDVYDVNTRAKQLYKRLGFKDLRQQMSLTLK